MDPQIREYLQDEVKSPMHDAMLEFCLQRLRGSRSKMGTYYKEWDRAAEVYMRRRPTTEEDREAKNQDLPGRTNIPMTFAQVNTAVAFGYMLFMQRERFYEFNGVDDQDKKIKEYVEKLVDRDMQVSNYKQRVFQTLLNTCRFGLGVEKDWWQEEWVSVPVVSQGTAATYQGQDISDRPIITEVKRIKRREGNAIRSISPYRVFTDPGFHVSEWQRGSFVATDDEWSASALYQAQREGLCVGVEYIVPFEKASLNKNNRVVQSFSILDFNAPGKNGKDVYCITELITDIVPAELKDINGKQLSEEENVCKWLFWIANDNRVIRAEPLRYYHAQFPISISTFLPDQHERVMNSLAYMIDDLQGLISWFMNSRVAAVTRMVDGQMVVDPLGIDMASIRSRARIIQMTKAAAGKDANRFIKQIDHKDTTQGHVADVNYLTGLMQQITGVNDNAMGQYNGGRRSATEARSVTTGAASRMKLIFDMVWNAAYIPQANRLQTNLRQYISEQGFQAVCGMEAMQHFPQFQGTPEELIQSYDFVAFDGTLPSEKLFMAQQLQDLLALVLTNPQTSVMFDLDPNAILKETMVLRGLGNGGNLGFQQPTSPQALQQQRTMLEMIAQQTAPTPSTSGPPSV